VQENYLSVGYHVPPHIKPNQQAAFALHQLVKASDYIAASDIVGTRILKDQMWGLAPLHGALSCIAPGYMAQGNLGRTQFPSWLGRNSTANKRQRLLREAVGHMQATISGSKEEVRLSYMPALRNPLVSPLIKQGSEGVGEVIRQLDEYSLTKDDFDAIMEFELLTGAAKPAISQVPSASKAALTRRYNADHQQMKKVKGSKGEGGLTKFTEDGEDAEAADDGDADDAEADEEDAEFVPSAKKPTAAAAKPSKGKGKARA